MEHVEKGLDEEDGKENDGEGLEEIKECEQSVEMISSSKGPRGLTKLATAGGSPRGFQERKTRIQPTRRILPKPPKKYREIVLIQWVLGGEGEFLPYSCCLLLDCSADKPSRVDVVSLFSTSETEMVCHSRSISAIDIPYQRSIEGRVEVGWYSDEPLVATSFALTSSARSLPLDSSILKDLSTRSL